jgi:hypothetical protein
MGQSVMRFSRAVQAARRLHCGAGLDDGKPNRGSERKFCRGGKCKSAFQSAARRAGTGILLRRQSHRPDGHQMIDLSAMTVVARQAALLAAARTLLR